MIDPKVLEYINSESAKGATRDEITKNLMSGGGWSAEDIQNHFNVTDHGSENILSKIQDANPTKESLGGSPKKKNGILRVNFIIFLGYFLLAILLGQSLKGDGYIWMFIFFYAYALHAVLLILISIIEAIRGFSKKTKTGAGTYFLAGILILIIGFGACTATVVSGL